MRIQNKLAAALFAASMIPNSAIPDEVHFSHTAPEQVALYKIIIENPEYEVTNIQIKEDGTMTGSFGPITYRLVAIGTNDLISNPSAETNIAVSSISCRADFNNNGAVGMHDVGTILTKLGQVAECK